MNNNGSAFHHLWFREARKMTIDAHPELPEFEYIRPASLMEASRFLAQHAGEARPLTGGTDIFVRMRDGIWRDRYLVDVKHLDGADQLRFDPDQGLTIGAAVNMNRVLSSEEALQYYPLLSEACRSVASYQLRTRATVVGNICNASPAGDTIGACLVLGGVLNVHGVEGYRKVPLPGLFLGPGKTTLQPGDIVTAIQFPLPPKKSTGKYIKLGRNTKSDLAIIGVTVLGYPDSTVSSGYSFLVALASVAPVPLMVTEVREFLATCPPNPEAFKQAARVAENACNPIDDVRGSARYRKAMVRRLTEKALNIVWEGLSL
jgi:carbon-monoxide dehydrogenase medium subunit